MVFRYPASACVMEPGILSLVDLRYLFDSGPPFDKGLDKRNDKGVPLSCGLI